VLRHALKNAVIPVVTLIGLQIVQIANGTVILETIFGLPGMDASWLMPCFSVTTL
jgi:peptide/nickel transport system permease protein